MDTQLDQDSPEFNKYANALADGADRDLKTPRSLLDVFKEVGRPTNLDKDDWRRQVQFSFNPSPEEIEAWAAEIESEDHTQATGDQLSGEEFKNLLDSFLATDDSEKMQ